MRRTALRWGRVGAVAMAFAASVAAQTVYRCGPDGRNYSQQACDEGKPVRVDDARSESQRRDAERVAERDARGAGTLERERLTAQPVPAGAARIDSRGRMPAEPARTAKPAAKSKKKHRQTPSADDDFRAAAPKPAKKAARG